MTYTKVIEELKEFKNKSWDGMPEENIDVSIAVLERMKRIHSLLKEKKLRQNITKDVLSEEMRQCSFEELCDETYDLYSMIVEIYKIVFDELAVIT